MRTESQIEISLIEKLKELKYIYREDIKDKASLEENFRQKFEQLNKVHLSDAEFVRLKESLITSDVYEAAKILRETNTFKRDDDTPLQYTIVNTTDWCKNNFEVVNQLRINTDNSNHRYDVILLINGVPVVQIELKALQVTPRRAMEQIVEYKNDPGNGYTNSLLCFMQLFIVSNESNTYYFANNSKEHFCFNADERFLPIYQLADENNKKITHLHDFSQTLLRKCALGQLISKYMVLVASEKKLMIMRPYQIYAVRAIMDCIEQNRGNGYIWHTTGSGKTLTSFKASTLLKDNKDITKCLFVVDRKDLDKRVLTNSAINGVVAQNEYFDRKIVSGNNLSNYYVIEKGDYVYNPRISTLAPVGPISKNKIGRGIMSPLYTIFRFKEEDHGFYEYYFKTTLWHKYINSKSNTGARHDRINISTEDFMEMPVPVCPDPKEQQKIAIFLKSMDILIFEQENRIRMLQSHKKGLIVELFPSIEEVLK